MGKLDRYEIDWWVRLEFFVVHEDPLEVVLGDTHGTRSCRVPPGMEKKLITHKNRKNSDTRKKCYNPPKILTRWLYPRVLFARKLRIITVAASLCDKF